MVQKFSDFISEEKVNEAAAGKPGSYSHFAHQDVMDHFNNTAANLRKQGNAVKNHPDLQRVYHSDADDHEGIANDIGDGHHRQAAERWQRMDTGSREHSWTGQHKPLEKKVFSYLQKHLSQPVI